MSKHPPRSAKSAGSYRRRKPDPLFQRRSTAVQVSAPPVDSSRAAPQDTAVSNSQRVDFLVKLGIEALQARRLEDAEGYLTKAIEIEPGHALAHNCLGIVRRARGHYNDAIASYERALRCDPDYAEAHNNLGVACEATGENARAIAAYEAALRVKPSFLAARNNLGNVLTKTGHAAAAIEHLREVLQAQPNLVAAHNNLGLALSHLGHRADAERAFRRAIELQPTAIESSLNLGHLLRAAGQLAAAGECYRQVLTLQPESVMARLGVANVLHDQRRFEEALAEFECVLRFVPHLAEAQFGIGNARDALQRCDEAVAAWQRAIQIRPDYAEAHNNLGSLYQRQGHAVLAEREFVAATQAKPELLAAHNNLGNLYRDQDRMDLARASYQAVLSRQAARPLDALRLSTLCAAVWDSRDAMEAYSEQALREWSALRGAVKYHDLPELLAQASQPPYNLQYLAQTVRPLKEAYANIFRYIGPTARPRPSTGRVRLGMVVTAAHEVAFLRLVWQSLRRLDAATFDRTILCQASGTGLLRKVIADTEARLFVLPEQPHQVLPAIREQRFDILHYFEVGSDAINYFLPFFRLAPVQVTTWGIQMTSGLREMDGYLSSRLIETSESSEHYTEPLLLAESLLSYQSPVEAPIGATREAFGFSAAQHLYFCVQHLGKFHPDLDRPLGEILRWDPRGIVVGTEDVHGYGAQRLRERFARVNPDVASRLVILPRQSFADYLRLASVCDVMLDPLYCGGVTTTYDCLSLNKPIVTLPWTMQRGRYTLGCYQRMGMFDGVAASAEDYVRIAVRLGSDREWRETVSARIRETRARVFEDALAVTEHERLFLELIERSRQ